jgi:hypothetical protein
MESKSPTNRSGTVGSNKRLAALMPGASAVSAQSSSQMAMNQARKADLFAVGRIIAARAQRAAQGAISTSEYMNHADGIPLKDVRNMFVRVAGVCIRANLSRVLQLLQMQYRMKRNKTIMDAFIFLAHFGLLMIAAYNIFDVHEAFAANDAMRQRVVQAPIPANVYKKARVSYTLGTISSIFVRN